MSFLLARDRLGSYRRNTSLFIEVDGTVRRDLLKRGSLWASRAILSRVLGRCISLFGFSLFERSEVSGRAIAADKVGWIGQLLPRESLPYADCNYGANAEIVELVVLNNAPLHEQKFQLPRKLIHAIHHTRLKIDVLPRHRHKFVGVWSVDGTLKVKDLVVDLATC